MSEWLTYSLSELLLFSPRTYYRLFALYNVAIWPAQIVAAVLGLATLALMRTGGEWRGRGVAAILAACWLWVAWAYLLTRYDSINWAAKYFAVGFAIEALLLIWTGLIRNRLLLHRPADAAGGAGLGLFLFALLVQPLIGPLVGREWVQVEIFGIAPDPTAVATLGVLLTAQRPAWHLFLIPLIWCAISGATLWAMQSPDALLMPTAAVVILWLVGWKTLSRRHRLRGA